MSNETPIPDSVQSEIRRYLHAGRHDSLYAAWPGDNFLMRAEHGSRALRLAVIAAVNRRAPLAKAYDDDPGLDVPALAREKLTPMVQGLFPSAEQPAILDMLSQSIIFLTSCNVESVLNSVPFLDTAWQLANLYLLSRGSALLSEEANEIHGLSDGTTCYVSTAYFRTAGQTRRFEDYVVHEAAHVFHNCKRETIGLSNARGREWLLDVDFGMRETFAYACEAYSCIAKHGAMRSARKRLLIDIEQEPPPPDERVDVATYMQILRGAVASRNGWRYIQKACAPARGRRGRAAGQAGQ
jgi:hypothetical protein